VGEPKRCWAANICLLRKKNSSKFNVNSQIFKNNHRNQVFEFSTHQKMSRRGQKSCTFFPCEGNSTGGFKDCPTCVSICTKDEPYVLTLHGHYVTFDFNFMQKHFVHQLLPCTRNRNRNRGQLATGTDTDTGSHIAKLTYC
jgi:hypothetical protein